MRQIKVSERLKKQQKRRRSIKIVIFLAAAIIAFGLISQWVQKSSNTYQVDIPQESATPAPAPKPFWDCDDHTSSITDGKVTKTCNVPTLTPKPVVAPKKTSSIENIKEVIADKTTKMFGAEYVSDMQSLIFKESSFDPNKINPTSGACGLFQFYPCKKLPCVLDDIPCQLFWGLTYVEDRYGNPTNAWNHWLARVPIKGEDVGNWY